MSMSFTNATNVSPANPKFPEEMQPAFKRQNQNQILKAQEKHRLGAGDIGGLRISVKDPSSFGDTVHNKGFECIKDYQDRGCKLDEIGKFFIKSAKDHFETSYVRLSNDKSRSPLANLITVQQGLHEEVGSHNKHLKNFLEGGDRKDLGKAADQLKQRFVAGDQSVALAYFTCMALCRINNFR